MGTMIDLRVGNLVVDWGKNEFFNDHRSLFQKKDRRVVIAGENPAGQSGVIHTLSRSLREVLPRLALLGYTIATAREEYNSLLLSYEHEENSFPKFDAFCEAITQVDIGDVSADYEDDHSFGEFFREEIGPRLHIDKLFEDERGAKWDYAYMMENFAPWHALTMVAQKNSNLDLPVVWDYFEHMENGWSEQGDFDPALKLHEQFNLVTEGTSDSKVLQKGLAMLHPGVLDFFRFIDTGDNYPFTGVGNLANFCKGLIKLGVQNKTIVLFDNDAAGVEKYLELQSVCHPSSMRIIRLPDLLQLETVPCVGTAGETVDDINGRAASIEAYLDLHWKQSRPALFRWTNYVPNLNRYQGSLEAKGAYVRDFLELRSADTGYDTEKLQIVLGSILQAAAGIAAHHQARISY